ncbi:hypothetical protein A2U01_0113715, partial [Trifolium medium]|nr:hypothetical protein [Trifolium medium]
MSPPQVLSSLFKGDVNTGDRSAQLPHHRLQSKKLSPEHKHGSAI